MIALGDLLKAEHGESCDCETCLVIQPLVDARLASQPLAASAPEAEHEPVLGCIICGLRYDHGQ